MTERSSWPVRLTVALALTVVAVMGLSSVALAATPSQPLLADTWVSGVGKVSVRWYAATDADGHGVDYWLYRDIVPVTAARIASGESTLVASDINNTTWQTNATVSEIAQSYVWYYAVVAEDDLGNKSVPSLNMSPNLHGYRFDVNLIACTRCHSAHGVYKIPYTEKGSCYTCHGSTGFSAPLGAKSTYNTEASFYDTGTVFAGSKHRNRYMSDTKQECAACHSPHRSPYFYTAVGVYDAASSYRRMLRIEYATSTYAYYSRNSAPAQANEFCFSCHGSSAVTWDGKTINASTAIGVVGGPDAYANAGGDHNYAGYAASAHGTGVIYSNDYDASAATTDNPAVQCEACHHNHASATDKLIDYRSSDTTNAATWAQANLCYGCHSAASTETSVNTAVTTKPFAWNSRDVKAQFAKRSHHPVSATSEESGALTCANCHNVHSVTRGATVTSAWQMTRASDPENTKTNYTGTPTEFCLECHDGSAAEATITASTLVPYTPAFRSMSSSPFFTGWNKASVETSFGGSAHKATAIKALVGQFGCETCHDPHASDNVRLTALTASGGTANGHLNVTRGNSTTYSEEGLCYGCHDGRHGGMCTSNGCHNADIDYLNVSAALTATYPYRHPIATISGRHSDTETATSLGSGNRHAECVDCHDPHAAKTTLHTAGSSEPGGVLLGAIGVKVASWPGNGATVSSGYWSTERMTDETTDYEAYVCFKCHTAYSGQPFSVTSGSGTYTSTDVGTEFNPSNFGEHNVLGQSTGMSTSFTFLNNNNTTSTVSWDLPATAVIFDAGWGYASHMTCTDCHTNTVTEAKGPHGSSVKYLIDPAYTTQWSLARGDNPDTGSTNESTYATTICNKCHAANYVNMNGAHKYTKHFRSSYTAGGKCIACHIKIPHGWKRPRLLGYTTDGASYAAIDLVALKADNISDAEASENSGSWDKDNCITSGCDTHSTSRQSGTNYWP
ncbi:MAG: cytochrome c3 family protein [Coriobacteriia bacterium]